MATISCQLTVNMPEDGIPIFTHLIKSRAYAFIHGALLVPVQSSNISHVGFCRDSMTDGKAIKDPNEIKGWIYVLFKPGKVGNGSLYVYNKVPERIYLHLLNADSKAKYLHAVIKGRFHDNKIEEENVETITERSFEDA